MWIETCSDDIFLLLSRKTTHENWWKNDLGDNLETHCSRKQNGFSDKNNFIKNYFGGFAFCPMIRVSHWKKTFETPYTFFRVFSTYIATLWRQNLVVWNAVATHQVFLTNLLYIDPNVVGKTLHSPGIWCRACRWWCAVSSSSMFQWVSHTCILFQHMVIGQKAEGKGARISGPSRPSWSGLDGV